MTDTTQFANMHNVAHSHNPIDHHFGFTNFGPQSTSFDLSESSSSNATSSGDNHFVLQSRHPSQPEVTGSPASSYARSLSDGRNNSIPYSQPPSFKVPTAMSADRRTSSPLIVARNQLAGQEALFQQTTPSRHEMHSSLWTPNFSFGGPSQNDVIQRVPDNYIPQTYSAKQQFPDQRRGSQVQKAPVQDVFPQYHYDRRMSHPVLPSSSLEMSPQISRARQASAVDWRSFTAANNLLRPGVSESAHGGFQGCDALWNTLDSARGMVAMSHQGMDANLGQFTPNSTVRRQSVPFLPDAPAEDSDPLGSSLFPSRHGSGSDDSLALPPSQESRPDQASMMNTFSAKDTNTGHKKHICPVCKKRFTRPSSLTTHIYSHTGEKPFICDVDGCGRHFSVISNLRRHRKIHSQSGSSTTSDHMGLQPPAALQSV